jgi:hypothetical protein
MTAAVRQILKSFDDLPAPERHEAAVEILRRAESDGDLPDAALMEAADDLFKSLDADEQRSAR